MENKNIAPSINPIPASVRSEEMGGCMDRKYFVAATDTLKMSIRSDQAHTT
jgi:hypothetical protein